jgi:hypothetical protein
MSRRAKILISFWLIFSLWVGGAWLVRGRQEQTLYTVTQRTPLYEVREYEAYLSIQVLSAGEEVAALHEGNRLLERYWNGYNTSQEVLTPTSPLLQEYRQGVWIVSFPMPARYSADTVARPEDPRIRFLKISPRRMAVVLRAGWIGKEERVSVEEELRVQLTADRRLILGPVATGYYGSSWMPSFMRQTSIMLPIR